MKHEEISRNTKKALAEALKRAMERKPFRKITVSELIQDCDVNRKTFYYHFEDIYALLKWTLEEDAIEVVKQFNLLKDYEEAILFIMDYIDKNEHIINCAYDSIGRDELKRFFHPDFFEICASFIESAEKKYGVELEESYRIFLTAFYTEALSGLLIDWIRERHKRDRDLVITYIIETIRDSLAGVLKNYRPDSP